MSAKRLRSHLVIGIATSTLFLACTDRNDGNTTNDNLPATPQHASVSVGPALRAQPIQQALLAFRWSSDGAITGGSRIHHATVRNGTIAFAPYTFEAGTRTQHSVITLETAAISVGGGAVAIQPALASIANGSILVPRGGVIENLSNDIDGLHQEWSFASSPGDGDLVVEVAFSGYPLVATTRGGLHFASDGAMVRYSNAVWNGADGQQWPIAASYDESSGHIRMTIPASVVAATKFPAVLDPTISSEVAADSPVIAPTGQTQQQNAIAFGGGQYLAVWSDNRDNSNNADIWGARIGSDGTLIDTLGIEIAADPGTESRPAVAFDGTSFVVVWEDFQTPNSTVSNVAAARVGSDGTVTSLGHVTSSASSEGTPNVASRGDGTALAVWNTAGQVDSAIITTSIGPTVALATGAVVERPSVASDPSGDYLVGYTLTDALTGQFVTAAGALGGSAFTISAPASGEQSQSDASFDGSNYDVVWRNGADALVFGTAISTAGVVLNTRTVGTTTVGGVALNASPAISFVPTITCQSSGCLVAWQDERNEATTSYDLFAQLITLGFAGSGSAITLSDAPGPQTTPRIASFASGFFASWTDNRNLASTQIFGTTVSTTGTVGTASDIATGNNRESGLAIGVSGTDTGLFWRDSRGGPSIYSVGYDSNGSALETTGQPVEEAAFSQSAPSASADLGGNTLVVWEDTRGGSGNNIYGARFDVASGTALDGSGIAISTADDEELVPAVASNGTVALVVWQDDRNGNFDIYGALVDSSGAVDVNNIAVSVGSGAQDDPAVTWDPTSSQFIVIWQDSRSGTFQIMGTRVDATGTVLDPSGVQLVASSNAQDQAAIGSTAANTLAIWQESNHVVGTRLSGGSALTVLDTSEIAISPTSSNQTNPGVAALGAAYLVAWSDDATGNENIDGQLVATTGSLQGAEFSISTAEYDEDLPKVTTTSASTARVAYEARTLDTSRAVSRVITNAIESITVTPADPSVPKGSTQQFTATATFSDGSTGDVTSSVTWTSGTTTVATITAGGLATAVAQGTSTITATSGTVSGSTVMTVGAAALASIAVTPAAGSGVVGFELQFVATGTFTDGSTANITSTVVWASSNTSVATISNTNGSRGEAKGVGGGSATVSATESGITGTATYTVSSTATLVSIAVTPATNSMSVNQVKQLQATGTFSNGTQLDMTLQVTWSSSNTAAAKVGTNGVVTAVALGSATISAKSTGVTGTASVSVVPPSLVSIAVTPANPFIVVGNTETFTATGTFSDGSIQNLTATATWTSSKTTVATMASNVATAVAAGSSTITATSSGISGTTTLNVTKTALTSIAVTPANPSVPDGFEDQFVATGTFADGSTANLSSDVVWASSNTAAATISNTTGSRGIATVVATSGSTTISAVLNGITGSTTLTATNASLSSIAVTPATNTMTVGQTKQLHAIATFSDGTQLDITLQVKWSSSNVAVVTIGTNGVPDAVADGSATISATKNGVTGTASITVN